MPTAAPTASTPLSTGNDSPVSTLSSHERASTFVSRMSAGTIAPMESRTMSPGTRSVTSTSCAVAVAHGRGPAAYVAGQGLRGARRAVVVDRPEADAGEQDGHDDHGVRPLAEHRAQDGRGEQQDKERAAHLPDQHVDQTRSTAGARRWARPAAGARPLRPQSARPGSNRATPARRPAPARRPCRRAARRPPEAGCPSTGPGCSAAPGPPPAGSSGSHVSGPGRTRAAP